MPYFLFVKADSPDFREAKIIDLKAGNFEDAKREALLYLIEWYGDENEPPEPGMLSDDIETAGIYEWSAKQPVGIDKYRQDWERRREEADKAAEAEAERLLYEQLKQKYEDEDK